MDISVCPSACFISEVAERMSITLGIAGVCTESCHAN
jgi:hypothetical protein